MQSSLLLSMVLQSRGSHVLRLQLHCLLLEKWSRVRLCALFSSTVRPGMAGPLLRQETILSGLLGSERNVIFLC